MHLSTDDEPPSPRRLIDAERRVHRILRGRFAEAFAELAVSFAQLEVMELLHDHEAIRAPSDDSFSSPASPPITWCGNSSGGTSSTSGRTTAGRSAFD